MALEFDALQRNRTWHLVDRPQGANVVSGKWVLRYKLNPNGTLECYKARWVVCGFTQRVGIDFGETFSPVVKPATIRTVLAIAASNQWPTKQLESLMCSFMVISMSKFSVSSTRASSMLIALTQSVCSTSPYMDSVRLPRAWFTPFAGFVTKIGFKAT